MLPRKLLPFTTLLLTLLGIFLFAHTLPAHSQGNPAADLGLHKAVTPLTALAPGDEIQYTLTFSNAGVLTATDVLISDTLPTLLTGVAIASNFPITSTGQASWIVAPLPPGAGGIITVTATVSPLLTSEQPFTNTATITSPITDTEPANNASFVVSEVNLPPVVDAGPDASAIVGQPFALTATFTDPGLDDTHTAEIAWGDGLTGTAILSETAHTLSATHVYTATGAFTVAVGVRDNDGGQSEDSLSILVENGTYILWLPVISNRNPMEEVEIFPGPNRLIGYSFQDFSAYYGSYYSDGLALLPETVNTETFVIQSLQTGMLTGTVVVDYSDTRHMFFDLSYKEFQPGEVLFVTLTTEVVGVIPIGNEMNNIRPSLPTVWQLQVPVSGGSGFMLPGGIPSLGGGDSTDVASGDLDHDGDADLVIANLDQPSATVWVNDGGGNFSAHPTTPAFGTGGYEAVALGDLDNDSDLDALFATQDAEWVWLNDGQGDFSPHPTAPSFGAGSSLDIALGDLNGDGFFDALVANTDGEPETLWLNDGTGAFFPHPTTPAFGGQDSMGIAIGDVDIDFDLDVVVANANGEPETVWLNDGLGNLTASTSSPEFGAGNSQMIALADLDLDFDLDIVVANTGDEPETVWLNDGNGHFQPHSSLPAFGMENSLGLALGDLNGDFYPDVVVANGSNEPETVWLNDGSGGFSSEPATSAFGNKNSYAVGLADLDGDGDFDAIVANANGEPTTVWFNEAFQVSSTLPAGNDGVATDGTLTVTFDRAINPDTVNNTSFIVNGVFTGHYFGTFTFPTADQVVFTPDIPFKPDEKLSVSLTANIRDAAVNLPLRPYVWQVRGRVTGGSGIFNPHPTQPILDFGVNNLYPGILMGDVNGDQTLDVVSGDSVWLNDGTATFTQAPTPDPAFFYEGTLLGDLDNDGDLDAISGYYDFCNEPLSVWMNDGLAHWTLRESPTIWICSNIPRLVDINGDGYLDMVGEYENIWLNNGEGDFSPHPVIQNNYDIWSTLLGDLDNDGDIDVLRDSDYYQLKISTNTGNGVFRYQSMIQNEYPWAWPRFLRDLDTDSDLDLVGIGSIGLSGQTWYYPVMYFNDGTGHFERAPGSGGGGVLVILMADLNGDTFSDFLVLTSEDYVTYDAVEPFMNDGLGNFTLLPNASDIGYYDWVAVGDLDGDGDLDFIGMKIDSPGPETEAIWLNQNQ